MQSFTSVFPLDLTTLEYVALVVGVLIVVAGLAAFLARRAMRKDERQRRIAAEQIGNAAGYVNAAQYGAMLAVGLLGASLFDRWRADRAMIGAKYASAVLALLPVAGFYVWAFPSRCW